MNSTRHKPRGWTEAELEADHAMRLAVRRYIRVFLPGHPKPPGAGWLVALATVNHPPCGNLMLAVKVPGLDVPDLVYCPECRVAGRAEWHPARSQ